VKVAPFFATKVLFAVEVNEAIFNVIFVDGSPSEGSARFSYCGSDVLKYSSI
jgi:hypothetical protein